MGRAELRLCSGGERRKLGFLWWGRVEPRFCVCSGGECLNCIPVGERLNVVVNACIIFCSGGCGMKVQVKI